MQPHNCMDDLIASFRSDVRALRRQGYEPSERRSQSLAVAHLAARSLMRFIDGHQKTSLRRMARLLDGCERPYDEVASGEVVSLLHETAVFGQHLQSCTPFHFQLLIANVARRALAILRASASESRVPPERFEQVAMDVVSRHAADSDTDSDTPQLRHTTSSYADRSPDPPTRCLPRSASICDAFTADEANTEFPVELGDFVSRALQMLQEYVDEMGNMTEALCESAAQQLVENETVLTVGGTHSTLSFLLSAASSKPFHLIVLQGAPLDGAATLVKRMQTPSSSLVRTQLLPDSSVFAVMPRASKVVVSCETVLANGGILAPIGTHMVGVVAKHFTVPVIVVTMTLKLCPYYPSDAACSSLVRISKKQANELPWSAYAFPGAVVPLSEVAVSDGTGVVVPSMTMEYVPPDLIALFATNGGEFTVPQVHHALREHYVADDYHV